MPQRPEPGESLALYGWAAIVGGACWVASELIELVTGEVTTLSLALTAVAFLGVATGVLGIHAVQRSTAGWASWLGANAMSVGFFALVVPVAALLAGTYDSDAEILAAGGPIALCLTGGSFAVMAGGALLGVTVVLARVFPAWLGGTLVVLLAALVVTMVAGGPAIVGQAINLATAIVLALFGRHMIARATREK